jgi:hypothetical protein
MGAGERLISTAQIWTNPQKTRLIAGFLYISKPACQELKKLRNINPGAHFEHKFYFSVFDTKAHV